LRFAEGSEAISTVIGREVDVQVVLRDLMSILLTLFALSRVTPAQTDSL